MSPNKKKKARNSSAKRTRQQLGDEDVANVLKNESAISTIPESLSDEKSDSDENSQGIVNVDFEFFDPRPEDYHGVKALLKSYLDDTTWDLSGFVDIILSQTTVGTVIKTAEDESPIGVITALNLGRYKDQTCVKDIHQFLRRNCIAESDAAELEAVFEKQPDTVGLVVSERIINIPEELAPPLHQGLFDEIAWATEDEPTKALRDSFKFSHYLIMTRIFQQLPKKKTASKLVRKVKKQKRQVAETEDTNGSESFGEFIYTKPEDELLHKLSRWSCKFPVKSEALAAHEVQGLRQFRLVMVFSAQQLKAFRSQFCTM